MFFMNKLIYIFFILVYWILYLSSNLILVFQLEKYNLINFRITLLYNIISSNSKFETYTILLLFFTMLFKYTYKNLNFFFKVHSPFLLLKVTYFLLGTKAVCFY